MEQEPLPGLATSGERDEPGTSGRLHLVRHGEAARDLLFDVIGALRADDPLAPVTVVVPSTLAGLSLRRSLGPRGGFVNVRFTALARVAELLGAPEFAADGRGPLTRALRLESIRTVLAPTPAPLPACATTPPPPPRSRPPSTSSPRSTTQRGPLATRSERAAAVVRLYHAYRELTADTYDVTDVAHAAAEAVRAGTDSAAEIGHVVLHLPESIAVAEAALLGALAPATDSPCCWGSAATRPPTTASPARSRRASGRCSGNLCARRAADPPLADRLVSAPDPDDEVRTVARELDARAARGEPARSRRRPLPRR